MTSLSVKSWFTPRNTFVAALLVLLALLPVYCAMIGNTFLLSLFTRILILGMAAVSLNLIMGFGGMVSFGHAAYLGIGGYVFGILAKEGSRTSLITTSTRGTLTLSSSRVSASCS